MDGMIFFIRRGANDHEWTKECVSSGLPEITHIEKGEGSRLVIASKNGGIFLWDIDKRKVVPSEEPVRLKADCQLSTVKLTVNFPHVCVIGGWHWKGLVVLNVVSGKQIRHVETDLCLGNIHCNGRFVLVTGRREVIMYDMEELSDESIKDADLWSRRMSFTTDYCLKVVSNKTKFAVSYGKKLEVYDVWKDRDY